MRSTVLQGLSWSAAQKWASRLAGLASFIVLSRLLDPKDFGLVALASAVVTVLQLVTDGGFSAYLIQTREIGDRTISTAFWTALLVSVVSSVAVVVTAPVFALLFHEPGLTPVLMVLAIGVLITGLSSVQAALLARELRFKQLAKLQVGASVLSTVAALTAAFLGAGVWALVIQSLVLAVATTVMLWIASSWRPSRVWDKAESKAMLSYSWKVLGANLLNQVRDRGEQFIIAAIGGTVLLGYWTIASRILQIMMELTVTVLQSVTLPVFSRLKDDPERLRRGYRLVLTYTAAIVVPVVVLASQTSPTLVPLVFGDKWQPSADVAAVITLTGFAWAMNSFDRSLYQAFARPGVDLVLSSVIAVLQVVTVLIVAPYGLVALAVASIARAYGVWPFRLAVLKRVCGLPWSSYTGFPPIVLAGALSAGAMVLVKHWFSAPTWGQVAVLCLAGGVTYVVFASLFSPDVRRLAGEARGVLRRKRGGTPTELSVRERAGVDS
ncbi:lipopolysaccharide biosynthesis protein [Kineococcus sp. NPDC059986]|uniref:lipopolysaccharide biosynthesis protein n=1 Tax=Kineococcus sp. NPDC059986 TaxID=3155538 RepID=UPI00344F8013